MEFLLWRWAKYRPQEEKAGLKAEVRAEVVSLSVLQREAILWRFWEELTIAEISLRMNLGEKSVEKLLETGLSTLKRRLTASGFGKDLVHT